jgi:hypothetical protein
LVDELPLNFDFFSIHLPTSTPLTMSPVTHNPSDNSGLELLFLTIPQSLLLQLGTASIMALLIAEKATTNTLTALGEASEELFRGERLPILNFPEPANPQT